MVFIDQIKHVIAQIQTILSLSKQLKNQEAQLKVQLAQLKAVQDDLQVDINKMNFKNKPHLDRIQETTAHLKAELSKYQA